MLTWQDLPHGVLARKSITWGLKIETLRGVFRKNFVIDTGI